MPSSAIPKGITSGFTLPTDIVRRADRLFSIVGLLRGGRYVTARRLAERLEVSERTIYRDIDELSRSGVPVEGEAGRGFRLPATFEIPPLMFDRDELTALIVGAQLLERLDLPQFTSAARSALARIRAVVPADRLAALDDARIFAPAWARRPSPPLLATIHRAIEERKRIRIAYAGGEIRDRSVRPLALYFWERVWTLGAWCEAREAFRNFRVDRITEAHAGEPFPDEAEKTFAAFAAAMRARNDYGDAPEGGRPS
jgi:predicted DNA-binding transcriptional regulator YafY